MLKAKRLAYDGRGNAVVRSSDDFSSAVQKLGGYESGLFAEKWVNFTKELAVIVIRSRDGKVRAYPVTETIQKDSVCHVTETPAVASEAALSAAQSLAMKAVASLAGAGAFGVEMFLLEDDSVLLNEVAPRVHNSGHYTINACSSSQFENHIRAMLNWPLGDTQLSVGSAIMLNILGEAEGAEGQRAMDELINRALTTPGCSLHWYDKQGVSKGRKMGHINITGRTRTEARERLGKLDHSALVALQKTSPDPALAFTRPLPQAQGGGGEGGSGFMGSMAAAS